MRSRKPARTLHIVAASPAAASTSSATPSDWPVDVDHTVLTPTPAIATRASTLSAVHHSTLDMRPPFDIAHHSVITTSRGTGCQLRFADRTLKIEVDSTHLLLEKSRRNDFTAFSHHEGRPHREFSCGTLLSEPVGHGRWRSTQHHTANAHLHVFGIGASATSQFLHFSGTISSEPRGSGARTEPVCLATCWGSLARALRWGLFLKTVGKHVTVCTSSNVRIFSPWGIRGGVPRVPRTRLLR